MPARALRPNLLAAALALAAPPAGAAHAADAGASALVIEHIEMVPTHDGFYDATVGFVMKDAKLGKDGRIAFSIPVAHVHDADEAMTKIREPVRTFGEDLRSAYFDIHREP